MAGGPLLLTLLGCHDGYVLARHDGYGCTLPGYTLAVPSPVHDPPVPLHDQY